LYGSYAKFIPNMSAKLHQLYHLLNLHATFQWSEECNTAFNQIKEELTSPTILTTFNPDLPLFVETDASPIGPGAILSHKIDGHLQPIEYASRSLSKAEQNYSHLDREATAIYWATTKFYQYLYGHVFTLITDNKPLQTIFSPSKHLPSTAAQRLLRYALHLRQFEYTIQHRSGKEHTNVDYLSRQPIQ
jgi:hypothetical protein